jgi:predicted negative regulator of RcsB-dependent stress response
MDNYETEDQQVEAIKKWWDDNFKMVIAVGVVGIGSIIGMQQWNQGQHVKAQTASVEYDYILKTVNTDAAIQQQVKSLQAEYSSYPYAALSAMLEAKKLIDAEQFAEAEKQYHWVVDHSDILSLQHIARLRLASLMAAQGKNDAALTLLNVEQDKFKANYLELKGDILVTMADINKAKAAYDQALQAYAAIGANTQILRVKRNDLGNS